MVHGVLNIAKLFFTDIKVGVVSFEKPNKRGLSALFIQWGDICITITTHLRLHTAHAAQISNCIQEQKLVRNLMG